MTPLSLAEARKFSAERQMLTRQLKQALIDCLALDKEAEDIPNDCLLFGVGLGLDSVDALEIVVAIETEFGLRVEDEHMKEIRLINSIVDLVQAGTTEAREVA